MVRDLVRVTGDIEVFLAGEDILEMNTYKLKILLFFCHVMNTNFDRFSSTTKGIVCTKPGAGAVKLVIW